MRIVAERVNRKAKSPMAGPDRRTDVQPLALEQRLHHRRLDVRLGAEHHLDVVHDASLSIAAVRWPAGGPVSASALQQQHRHVVVLAGAGAERPHFVDQRGGQLVDRHIAIDTGQLGEAPLAEAVVLMVHHLADAVGEEHHQVAGARTAP